MRIATDAGQHDRCSYLADTVSVGAIYYRWREAGLTVVRLCAAREPGSIDVATLLNNMGAYVALVQEIIAIDGCKST